MKVLQINFLNMFSTGNIMLNIARVTRERGYEAFTASKYTRDAILHDKGIVNHYYVGSRVENTFHRYFSWYTDLQDICSCLSTRRLIRHVEKINPDIIHLHDVVGWYLNIDVLFAYLKRKNIPVVWTFHDCWAFTGRCIYFDAAGCDRWKNGCGQCPQKRYMPGTKAKWDLSAWNWRHKKRLFSSLNNLTIVTPSEWLKNLTEQSFLAGKTVKVINNGINLEIFKPTKGDFYQQVKADGKKIVLGLTALWAARKGLKEMNKLAEELPTEYKVIVVGSVQDGQLSDRIFHIDRTQNQAELAQLYTAADVYVNPTFEDNFPTVNLESLACGTPIVTYRTGGSPESVTEQTGLVVEKGDYKALKAAVMTVCEKGKEAYTDACLEAAKKYDMNARFNDYVDLYEEVLKNE